jgi:glycine amidinotransferase
MNQVLERKPTTKGAGPVVNSYNEWDPLEEVIVGIMDQATIPSWDETIRASMPSKHAQLFKNNGGQSFPQARIEAAAAELENFIGILEKEGVKVVRPEPVNNRQRFQTPDWESPGGLYQAMPRDSLLIIGDLIIESPMAWRSRYFETNGFKHLLKEYFQAGARWISAPKPELRDELFNFEYDGTALEGQKEYGITEFEPTFDAADFSRCGTDIFVQRSNVTNQFGIEWVQRVVGDKYKVHVLDVCDSHPMHIDATFVPLKPGYVLVNAERLPKLPKMFDGWKVIKAPQPVLSPDHNLYMSSNWLSVNTLMLDTRRIFVESNETPLMEELDKNGFEPIPCPFTNFNSFGGSFHCATCDIRRSGGLESYFDN